MQPHPVCASGVGQVGPHMRATYEQAERFLAVAPRPKLRNPTLPKPGAKAGPTATVHAVIDQTRGLVLLRGKHIGDLLEYADLRDAATWSVGAKGYVLPLTLLGDVEAACQRSRSPFTWREVKSDE